MIKCYGIDHATLTVSDLERTRKFYSKLFGIELRKHKDNSFNLLKAGVPCWFVQWEKQYPKDQFDELRVGLDHIAFELKTVKELEEVVKKLDEMGIPNAGLERYGGKYPYVAFRDPDNIQTEFFISEEE